MPPDTDQNANIPKTDQNGQQIEIPKTLSPLVTPKQLNSNIQKTIRSLMPTAEDIAGYMSQAFAQYKLSAPM